MKGTSSRHQWRRRCRFLETLDKGLRLLDEIVAEAKRAGQTVISGEALFKLYDTYGFPLDLAADSARDQGMSLDDAGFQVALQQQRERARKSTGFEAIKAKAIYAEASRVGRLRCSSAMINSTRRRPCWP